MCVSPTFLYADDGPGFERLEVACGWCWSCQKNRLNDLVGRCLCEASTSDWVLMIRLSYREPWPKPMLPDAIKAGNQKHPEKLQIHTIQKQDCQNFLKHFRRRFKTRYLVAGEYGSKGTERAHFHVILFGLGQPPSWELNKNIHIDFWPWGHVYVQNNITESSIRYACKYLLKGAKRKKTAQDNNFNREWISYSRIPIMGINFVHDLAARYAAERVFPHSFKYRPPWAQENREYQFIGEARHVFFDALLGLWPEAAQIKKTESMEKAFIRYKKDRHLRAWENLTADEQQKLLAIEIKRGQLPDNRSLRLYGRYLFERMNFHGSSTVVEFAEKHPAEYAEVRAVFKRDLKSSPPTYAETGIKFPF